MADVAPLILSPVDNMTALLFFRFFLFFHQTGQTNEAMTKINIVQLQSKFFYFFLNYKVILTHNNMCLFYTVKYLYPQFLGEDVYLSNNLTCLGEDLRISVWFKGHIPKWPNMLSSSRLNRLSMWFGLVAWESSWNLAAFAIFNRIEETIWCCTAT